MRPRAREGHGGALAPYRCDVRNALVGVTEPRVKEMALVRKFTFTAAMRGRNTHRRQRGTLCATNHALTSAPDAFKNISCHLQRLALLRSFPTAFHANRAVSNTRLVIGFSDGVICRPRH